MFEADMDSREEEEERLVQSYPQVDASEWLRLFV